ncbi:glycerophosphoryl diester phosphodiesterase membrane domain-containing protein [Streptosporangium lutulentum]|uniref:Glycerophosphoryl diester phosphodiesterase membrane domain-containing protein n=1 Tax=Streptosporangium lutulentum TaxID=1461250 RepID=A0ABT9QK61_9ACTN|nr:glycerophosphoryl diester phosphodiesterase membrane domain-containing protein [Streptosporangium lutulentum]MDP9846439.1 hypothetical protein [Streptosporangium lutulentum]
MSDGHGSTPGTPSGWAPNQPPPYSDTPGSPWTAPGSGPDAPPPGGPRDPGQAPDRQDPSHRLDPYDPRPPYGDHRPPPATRPGIVPLRPLGLGDILDGAIQLIRSDPKTVLGLSAIAAALGAIPVAIGQALVLGSLVPVLRDPSAETPDPGFLSQYGTSLFSYTVQFVAVVLLSGLLTGILGRAFFGGRMTAGDARRLVRSRAPALAGLAAVGVLLLLAPLFLLAGLLVTLDATGAVGALLNMLAVLGFLAYACLVITRLAFAAPVAVMERRGVADSLRRSWYLVTGGFWRTFGVLLLTLAITVLISNVLAFPFTLAGVFIGFFTEISTASQIAVAVLIAVGGIVGTMITYPFQAAVNGLLYADRRMRAEAFDLVLLTEAIEQRHQGRARASAGEAWDPSTAPGDPARSEHFGQGSPWSRS